MRSATMSETKHSHGNKIMKHFLRYFDNEPESRKDIFSSKSRKKIYYIGKS